MLTGTGTFTPPIPSIIIVSCPVIAILLHFCPKLSSPPLLFRLCLSSFTPVFTACSSLPAALSLSLARSPPSAHPSTGSSSSRPLQRLESTRRRLSVLLRRYSRVCYISSASCFALLRRWQAPLTPGPRCFESRNTTQPETTLKPPHPALHLCVHQTPGNISHSNPASLSAITKEFLVVFPRLLFLHRPSSFGTRVSNGTSSVLAFSIPFPTPSKTSTSPGIRPPTVHLDPTP